MLLLNTIVKIIGSSNQNRRTDLGRNARLPLTYDHNFFTIMALRFLNKVVIVTGGSKGIGAGIGRILFFIFIILVEEFVKNGSKVVFCCRNPKEGKAFVNIH